MRNLKRVLVLLGLGMTMWACNSGGGGFNLGTAPSNAELLGTWYFRHLDAHMTSRMVSATKDTTETFDTAASWTGTANFITFSTDGTYNADFPDLGKTATVLFKSGLSRAPETGTWMLNGSHLTTVSNSQPPETTSVSVGLTGTTLNAQMVTDETETYAGTTYTSHMDFRYSLSKQP